MNERLSDINPFYFDDYVYTIFYNREYGIYIKINNKYFQNIVNMLMLFATYFEIIRLSPHSYVYIPYL